MSVSFYQIGGLRAADRVRAYGKTSTATKKVIEMKKTLLAIALASQLVACGTTNNYYVVSALTPTDFPKPATSTAQVEAGDWDMDEQFPAMFKYLGCTSFGNGEHEPVCLEIRKLVQACMDYNAESGIGSGINRQLDKTCNNMVNINWIQMLNTSKT